MCGLVGIMASDMNNKHKQCLKLLLYFDTLRGEDSTGVAAIRSNYDVVTFKSTVPGFEYVNDPRFDNLLKMTDKVWIGHNRYGTMGKKTKANAHPFEVVDQEIITLVGAHNGTLKNKYTLDNEKDFGTDSELLLNMIYHQGPKEAISKVGGAWALTWFNALDNTLNFLRNKERTFFFAYEEGKKAIIWASEQWMIKTACQKAGLKIEGGTIYTTVEDRLYTWDLPTSLKDTLSYSTEEGLEGKPETFFQNRYGHKSWYGDGWEKEEENVKKAVEEKSAKTGSNVVPLSAKEVSSSGAQKKEIGFLPGPKKEPVASSTKSNSTTKLTISRGAYMVKGFKGTLIAKPDAQLILDSGCAWCEEELITLEDAFGWMSPNHVVCHKCLTDKHPQPPYMASYEAYVEETYEKRKVN